VSRHAGRAALQALVLTLLSATAGADLAVAGQAFAPVQLKDFPRGQMTIERAQGRDTFQVWIADTQERVTQGLMWVRELPPDHGMVFVLGEPRSMNMWMKNTYVPLDMLFFGADGRILSIVRNTTPLSTELIGSGGVIHGVVEILGGEATRRGIEVGDRIRLTPQRAG
jgi:uncharacterized protein